MCAYRFGQVDADPGHANKGPVEVLDGRCCILMRLVTNKADAAVGNELDISDLATLGREVFAELSLGNRGRQVLDEHS